MKRQALSRTLYRSLGAATALALVLGAPSALAQKPTLHNKPPAAHPAPPTKAQLNAALISAISQRDPERVRDLLKRGADPNTVSDGTPALVRAAASGPKRLSGLRLEADPDDTDMVLALLEAGANTNATDASGRTALAKSVTDRTGSVCMLLLDHHASVDLADKHGVTPLMLATVGGHGYIMDLLLEHKADPNARAEAGLTPLGLQIVDSSADSPADVRFTGFIAPLYDPAFLKLIAQGADLSAKTDAGDSLLALAISRSNMAYVPFLLEKGADINAKNKEGITPLLYAAGGGHAPIVRYLLDHGADPKVVGPDGVTALHLGVEQGSYAMVELLIRKGVDVSAKMTDGNTALMIAREKKLTGIINLLVAAGAKE